MSIQYYYDYDDELPYSLANFHRIFDAFSSRNPIESSKKNRGEWATSEVFQPKIDVHESSESNLVTATFELPGMNKDDVNIDVQNNRLAVSGETKLANDIDRDGFVVKERRFGKFTRTLPLPAGTQADQIKAAMENGVLTVTFPKISPEQAAKRITIS